ncbi:hypothetical protein HK096_008210, partial [Nowakowskiella sp. JEL0078]
MAQLLIKPLRKRTGSYIVVVREFSSDPKDFWKTLNFDTKPVESYSTPSLTHSELIPSQKSVNVDVKSSKKSDSVNFWKPIKQLPRAIDPVKPIPLQKSVNSEVKTAKLHDPADFWKTLNFKFDATENKKETGLFTKKFST